MSWGLYLDSVLVCWRWEYVTFPFSVLPNAAVIEPGRSIPVIVVARTSWAFFALSASATTSAPQHFFACFRMLLVDLASPLSKYRLTNRVCPLQFFAMHVKMWQQWLSM